MNQIKYYILMFVFVGVVLIINTIVYKYRRYKVSKFVVPMNKKWEAIKKIRSGEYLSDWRWQPDVDGVGHGDWVRRKDGKRIFEIEN